MINALLIGGGAVIVVAVVTYAFFFHKRVKSAMVFDSDASILDGLRGEVLAATGELYEMSQSLYRAAPSDDIEKAQSRIRESASIAEDAYKSLMEAIQDPDYRRTPGFVVIIKCERLIVESIYRHLLKITRACLADGSLAQFDQGVADSIQSRWEFRDALEVRRLAWFYRRD